MVILFIGFVIFINGLFTSTFFYSKFGMFLTEFWDQNFAAAPSYIIYCLVGLYLILLSSVVIVFFRKSNLRERLPEKIPGYGWILTALILDFSTFILSCLVAITQGAASSFILETLSGFVLVPSKIFLTIGIFKVLLAARSQ